MFLEEATFPGGRRGTHGQFAFNSLGSDSWTSTEESETTGFITYAKYDDPIVERIHALKNCGFLVRCIKDQ